VHWRTFISAILVLALLPISPFAAICDLNCRTLAMATMAMNSPGLRHAVHDASPRPSQHHHSSSPTKQPAPDAGFVSATDRGQVSDNHQCCYYGQAGVSSSCVPSRLNDWQVKTAGPDLGDKFAIVQARASALALIIQPVNHSPTAQVCTSGPASHSLTLRI
jgi:hypothetical protein